jgi:hypothetical protein
MTILLLPNLLKLKEKKNYNANIIVYMYVFLDYYIYKKKHFKYISNKHLTAWSVITK